MKDDQEKNKAKSRFVTINVGNNKLMQKIKGNDKKTKGSINGKRIVDIGLIIALIAVSLYSLNLFVDTNYHSGAVFVNSNTEKKLPIYSVETPDKKVAISFDAAW